MGDDELKKRKTLQKKLEKLLDQVREHPTVLLDLHTAVTLMERAEAFMISCEDVHFKLITACVDEAAIEVQETAFEPIENSFVEIVATLKGIIKDLTPATTTTTSTTGASSSKLNIKLPAIELPTFSGNFADWPSFKDLFYATVDSNSHLAPSAKLQYLKSALRNEPAALIKSLTITDSHYTEALQLLKDRYDNQREIVTSLVNKLFNYKPINQENAGELQKFIDNTNEILRALKVMGEPVDQWNSILVVLLVNMLDPATKREWAIRQTGTTLPAFADFTSFITNHIRGLLASGASSSTTSSKGRNVGSSSMVKTHHVSSSSSCPVCSGAHQLFRCQEFLTKTPTERSTMVMDFKLCFNCLHKHQNRCTSKGSCKKCFRKHHTLLHEDRHQISSVPSRDPPKLTGGNAVPTAHQSSTPQESSRNASVSSHHVSVNIRTLLRTAVVSVPDKRGTRQTVRIFLDGGSDGTLITESCVKRLGLRRRWSNVTVDGVGNSTAGISKGAVDTTLISKSNPRFSVAISAHIMDSVTDLMPRVELKNEDWAHIKGLTLADPEWYHPSEIDILLGEDYMTEALMQGYRKGRRNTPSVQNTIFGWVLSGPTEVASSRSSVRVHHVSTDLDGIVRRFWEVEELPKVRILTKQEKFVEKHFIDNFSRDEQGHFVVGVPFNDNQKNLGESRSMAVKRFKSVERRLLRNPSHHEQYRAFMQEYEALGHMEKISSTEPVEELGKTYHLPHHHVINEGSSTTKLRVVFDGSAKTTTGISLNETLYAGATLQDDLYELLLRFRLHKIVIKADITKMFRQFRLRKEDADFHRIVWRASPDQPLQDYRLLTVTYGTACAPNLSTRCLQQLAMDVQSDYPLASKALLQNTYVDDVMASVTNSSQAIQLYHELSSAVATAGLQLRKWSTNDPTVLAAIPEEERETCLHSFDNDDTIKALGIQWCPSSDNFTFKCVSISEGQLTKRVLLSDLSRVFDPLGFLSCVTVRAKLQMQELWKLQIGWDEQVPPESQERWKEYQEEMQLISLIKIPRHITSDGTCKYQLHGFSDSSTIAYGCVIYLRAEYPDGTICTKFVTSKTRVAPLKQITLPKLELMSASELSELIDYVKQTLKIECEVWCWSDSTITLKWIASSPRRWKTFVANRVAKIQQHTEVEWWRHVPGKENPADLASRGVPVKEVIDSTFWFQGPEWLSHKQFPVFPMNSVPEEVSLEEKPVRLVCNHLQMDTSIMKRFSSLIRLKRVTAHVLRFLRNGKIGGNRQLGPLTTSELESAFFVWIRKVQQQSFSKEILALKNSIKLRHDSKLSQLFPFIDAHGILKVGGRLQHAMVPEYRKHQIILPSDSHLTHLIIQHCHHVNFHGGFQLTWSTLQTEFWIMRGRDKVRHLIRSCVICKRHRGRAAEQLMGCLPSPRINPSRPFLHVGVDYAGPYVLKNPVGRAPKTYKAYMCLFVCMATKAIHLEAVSSLSTAAFIEALRRFVARRGVPGHVYSDCGTNFIGAEKELKRHILSSGHQQQVENESASQGIQFHFNAPSSPHHGGLWEAGVKSAKHHLRRVVASKILTFEVFCTFLCQVEAILNSRPLHPLSADPTDLKVLTPGHFLIGDALTTIPEVDIRELNTNRLDLFQQQQQRLQHFWQRWSTEYLNTLQQRNKWKWEKDDVHVGDLVLIKEDTDVQQWRMGRIIKVHPGSDGNVRVVTLRTSSGQLQRPIVKLIPLLSQN